MGKTRYVKNWCVIAEKGPKAMKLLIVIPAYNEEENIVRVVHELRKLLRSMIMFSSSDDPALVFMEMPCCECEYNNV